MIFSWSNPFLLTGSFLRSNVFTFSNFYYPLPTNDEFWELLPLGALRLEICRLGRLGDTATTATCFPAIALSQNCRYLYEVHKLLELLNSLELINCRYKYHSLKEGSARAGTPSPSLHPIACIEIRCKMGDTAKSLAAANPLS